VKPQTYSFVVRPYSKSSLRVRVYVHPSRKGMIHVGRSGPGEKITRMACAYTETVDATSYATKRGRKSPIFANIHLCLGWLDLNTISHEATHAAVRWVIRKYPKQAKMSAEFDLEEPLAGVQGNLVTQIVAGLKMYGFLEQDLRYGPSLKRRRRRGNELRIVEIAA